MSQKTYHIGNLDCANCAKELEAGVQKLDGIQGATLDFSSLTLTVEGDVTLEALRQRVEAFGHTLESDADGTSGTKKKPVKASRGGVLGFWDYMLSRHDTRMALIGFALMMGGIVLALLNLTLISQILYTLALIVAVFPIARKGLNTLRINRQFSIDLLMSIAGIGALLLGEYLEAGMVVALYVTGEALEGYVTNRARDSIGALMELQPAEALRVNEGREEIIAVEVLDVDDVILVKAGERIPTDGIVREGHSAVNQAAITGESMPVSVGEGDTVYAGSINEQGTLLVTVTHRAADNTLSRIIEMVAEAQSRRAPSQRFIDQFAQYYTPAVVVVAALVAIVPPLLFGGEWLGESGWIYRALTMLVIACPCALVISTPVTVISAITRAARQGVLIKGGAHLEALGQVKTIAFDKTGTLTQGKPTVTEVYTVDCQTEEACPACTDMLALAAAVESRSTHPLAQAVIDEAQSRSVLDRYSHANDVQTISGRGISGEIDGQEIVIGSHRLFDEIFTHQPELCGRVTAAEERGHTTMLLHDGNRVRGYIAVSDKVRSSSADVIAELNAMGLETVMLTGDNPTVAQAVGDQLGVKDIRASLLPEDKVSAVEELTAQGSVAMVGDGINDTPALAQATVGVAMGGAGTAQAAETADIALMGDDLAQLPFAIKLARFARRLILENVTLAIGMKLIFLWLAASGGVTMWAAVFADVGMSLIVTLNAMRGLRFHPSARRQVHAEAARPVTA